MSADPIIYCLEHLTDYRQFERLSSDMMAASSFPDIEPIGGTGDRGRDAFHQSRVTGETTIFAYTVRSDWHRKLQEEKHNPNYLIFVCTSTLSGSDKDQAKSSVSEKYGWSLGQLTT